MRSLQAPLNLSMCKVKTRKHLCRVSVLIKLLDGALQRHRYFPVNFSQFHRNLFEEHLRKVVSAVFYQVLLFLCEELQPNENQWFNNYVNVTQFKKNTAKFCVMKRDIFLHEATARGIFLAKYSSSCMFIVFYV